MADFVATHRLTEEASLKMLQAGVAKANALGCKVSLAVVDASCRLIAFLMMDGARHFSIITTQRKAITAASQRQPTGYAPEANALSMSVRMGDFTNVPGGFPITITSASRSHLSGLLTYRHPSKRHIPSWPGIAVRRTASLRSPMSRPSTSSTELAL